MDLVVINNQMPYRAAPLLPTKTRKYIKGKINGDAREKEEKARKSARHSQKGGEKATIFTCESVINN